MEKKKEGIMRGLNRCTLINTFLFILIVFFGAVLRFINLGVKSFWYDEAVIFYQAKFPLAKIFHDSLFGGALGMDSVPFICYIPSHLFYAFTRNSSEFFLRLPSCFFGIGSIVLIYFLANLLFSDKKISLISSLLVTISQLQLWESQQLRPYSLAMFFSLLLLFFFFKFLKTNRDKDLVIFTFISMLCSLVHYLIILLVAINILVIIRFIKNSIINKSFNKIFIEKWILSQLIVFSFCLIEYSFFIKNHLGHASIGYLSNWYFHDNNIFQSIYFFFFRTIPLFLSYLPVSSNVFRLVLLIFLIGIVSLWQKENGKIFIILGFLSFILVYILSCNNIYPYIFGKRTIFLSPFFYIIISSACSIKYLLKSQNVDRLITFGLFIPIVLSSFWSSRNYLISPFYPTFTGVPNEKFVIEQFKKEYKKGDYLYIKYEGTLIVDYYFNSSKHTDLHYVFGNSSGDIRLIKKELEQFLKNKGRKWIYLVHMSIEDKNEAIQLIQQFAKIDYFIADPPLSVMLILCH